MESQRELMFSYFLLLELIMVFKEKKKIVWWSLSLGGQEFFMMRYSQWEYNCQSGVLTWILHESWVEGYEKENF